MMIGAIRRWMERRKWVKAYKADLKTPLAAHVRAELEARLRAHGVAPSDRSKP